MAQAPLETRIEIDLSDDTKTFLADLMDASVAIPKSNPVYQFLTHNIARHDRLMEEIRRNSW